VPNSYTLTNDQLDKARFMDDHIGFSVINLWYFWFAVVFIVTICTGICAFVRRQHRLFLLATERSAMSRAMTNTTVQLSAEAAYRHNYHQPACTVRRPPFYHRHRQLSNSVGHQLYFATVLSVGPEDDVDQEIHEHYQDPPSYSEVVSKSGDSCAADRLVDLPSYDEANRALQQQQHTVGCTNDTTDLTSVQLHLLPSTSTIPGVVPPNNH
jgi:hypothetical protein